MTFQECMHWIAQGAINLDHNTVVENGSKVHKAMRELCRLVSTGQVTADDLAKQCPAAKPARRKAKAKR